MSRIISVLSFVTLCHAAQLQMNGAAHNLNLAPIDRRAPEQYNFRDNDLKDWSGFQYLNMEDFEVRPEERHRFQRAQNYAHYQQWVDKQVETLGAFVAAQTFEDRISYILQLFFDIQDLNFKLSADGTAFTPEERNTIALFTVAQAKPVVPGLREALIDLFKIYNPDTPLFNKFDEGDYSDINEQAVRMPTNLRENDKAEFEDHWYFIAKNHLFSLKHSMTRYMCRDHPIYLHIYRERMVREALAAGVPAVHIEQTSHLPAGQWERDMQALTTFDFRRVFLPTYTAANGNPYDALSAVVGFINDPEQTADLALIVAAEDLAAITQKDDNARAKLLQLFIRQAYILGPNDDYRYLAGLTHALWSLREDDLEDMWNRNLYKESWKRVSLKESLKNLKPKLYVSWRRWIQTDVFNASKDDEVMKAHLKNMIEKVTQVSRNAWKKSWAATDIFAALRTHFNGHVVPAQLAAQDVDDSFEAISLNSNDGSQNSDSGSQ